MALCALKSLAFWENGWQGILARSLKGSTIPITCARRIAKLFPCRPPLPKRSYAASTLQRDCDRESAGA
jgi:hypothetical protein